MWNKMNGGEKSSKPHVVLVPYVGQGHLIPFLELTKLLAFHGLIVSYISTPGNIARLQPQVDQAVKTSSPFVDIRLVSLPMPPIRCPPPGIESSETVPQHMMGILMMSSYKLVGVFEQWLELQIKDAEDQIENSPCPPVCIISDIFTSWVHELRRQIWASHSSFPHVGSICYVCYAFLHEKHAAEDCVRRRRVFPGPQPSVRFQAP